jgi:putative flavoprotein involved in K+ transport
MELDGLRRDVVVIGAGQAGLAMSNCLARRHVEHLLIERDEAGHEWRDRRWESFCLVTPNWQCSLPGYDYTRDHGGADPDGFMLRDEIVDYLRSYVESFAAPLVEHTTVTRLGRTRPDSDSPFTVTTDRGTVTAEQVVIATGPYQQPKVPAIAHRLPADILQLHSAGYERPDQLPEGAVLVVGTGQSGCQIAEDLHLAGRQVHLATGTAPRVARTYRGRDVVAWLHDMGYYQRGIDTFPDADAVRFRANHYVTGRDGGHDIDLRAFARDGMKLYGRLTDIENGRVTLADDLAANLDGADRTSESIKDAVDAFIEEIDGDAPAEARYTPVWTPDEPETELDLAAAGITGVVWSTGFRRDDSWIRLPVFDGRGAPFHTRGVTAVPGVYVLGLPWLHTWGSGRFCGVGPDAEHVAAHVLRHRDGDAALDGRWLAGPRPAHRNRPSDDLFAPLTVA